MPEIDYTSGDSPSEVLDEFWRETLSGIRNGRWGSDIRTPIHAGILQLLEEKEIPEEEIEAALQKIAESIYGEEVRMAIHDALLLIHQESSQGTVEERIYYLDQICKILQIYVVDHGKFGFPVAWPESGSAYVEDNSPGKVSTITISANPTINGIGIMSVLYEQGDEPTITDSAVQNRWVLLHKFTPSGGNLIGAVYSGQISEPGSFTITLTKTNASARFHASLRCFYNKVQVNKINADTMDSLPNSANYIPASAITTGAYRYYILMYTAISPTSYMLSVDPNGGLYTHNLNYGIEECHLYYAGQDPNAPEDNPQKGLQPKFTISGSVIPDWATIGLSFL